MSKVSVYTTGLCPYCFAAKRLLGQKGVEFREIRVDQNPAERETMMQRSQRRTVPQIFVGDVHVGGYDDLAALDAAGELDPLLNAED